MHPVYIESTLLQFLRMQNFLVLNMFIKLFYFIRIFMLYSFIICISFVRIIFRIFYYFMFGCLFFLVFALLLCVCVNGLHVFYLFTKFTFFYFFHIHANTDKDANCFQSNYNSSSKNLWWWWNNNFSNTRVMFGTLPQDSVATGFVWCVCATVKPLQAGWYFDQQSVFVQIGAVSC